MPWSPPTKLGGPIEANVGHGSTVPFSDRPSPEQIERYRAMTPAERLRQSNLLYQAARDLRAAYERTLHPDWSAEQIKDHVRRIFLRAST